MKTPLTKLVYPELSYKITGVLFEVHNGLGRFRSEIQYGDAIEEILNKLGISFQREIILPVSFEGENGGHNKADFLIDNKVLIEIKAKKVLLREDFYQVKRYLLASKKRLGILVNFRQRYLDPKRILNSDSQLVD